MLDLQKCNQEHELSLRAHVYMSSPESRHKQAYPTSKSVLCRPYRDFAVPIVTLDTIGTAEGCKHPLGGSSISLRIGCVQASGAQRD